MVMEITSIGNVLVDVFELEAVVGLALLAIVIWMIARGLIDGRHDERLRSHQGSHR